MKADISNKIVSQLEGDIYYISYIPKGPKI